MHCTTPLLQAGSAAYGAMSAGGSIPPVPFDVEAKPSITRVVALSGEVPLLLPVRNMTVNVQVHVAGACRGAVRWSAPSP